LLTWRVPSPRTTELSHDKKPAAGEVLTAKQAPHRPGTAPALGLRAAGAIVILSQTTFAKETTMLFDRLFRFVKHRPAGAARRRRVRLTLEALDERLVPASLSVGDAVILEGNSGTQYALVSVNLDAPSKHTVSVNYATADGSASAGSDYGAVSGRLSFAPGETSKTIAVPVYGDRLPEPNETFFVNLSGAQRAKIADGQGVVTIAEDEPRLSIGDAAGTAVYTLDGTTGTTLTFTVSLAVAYDQAVTVDYATADGTATAGVDYVATSGTLTFAPGETTKTITVQVLGDDAGIDERFYVNLSGASGNAQIVDGQGVGTIHYYFVQPYGGPGTGDCDDWNPSYPNC